MRTLLLAATLGACAPKVPEHLQLDKPDPDQVAADEVPITDTTSALIAILGNDPLARSPTLPEVAELEALEDGEPLAAWAQAVRTLERGQGQVERTLQQVEDEWRGTAAVALSRGYRLRLAENQLAQTSAVPQRTERQVLALVTPLIVSSDAQNDTLPRRPLEWLLGSGPAAGVRDYADRWVLAGWLSAPSVDLEVVASPLSAPMYDGLRATPTGKLVLARGSGASDDTSEAWADLERATELALIRVAADRDKEQAAYAEIKAEVAAELGTDDDPEITLLRRAAVGLTAGAGDDRAAGGALLALAALRWLDACEVSPCAGVDRVEQMHAAERYHPEVAALATRWQVVALKDSIDTMDVAQDTVLFPDTMVDLVDALIGTGGGPLEARLLRRRAPDAQTWLTLARAVGTEGVTRWEGAHAAIGGHLENEVRRSIEKNDDPEVQALLERIQRRALP